MREEIVVSEITLMLQEKFKVNTMDTYNNLDVPFFLEPFSFEPSDLILFIMYIEEKFKIHFTKEDYANYGFLTPRKTIFNIVKKKEEDTYE